VKQFVKKKDDDGLDGVISNVHAGRYAITWNEDALQWQVAPVPGEMGAPDKSDNKHIKDILVLKKGGGGGCGNATDGRYYKTLKRIFVADAGKKFTCAAGTEYQLKFELNGKTETTGVRYVDAVGGVHKFLLLSSPGRK
jgi:hypothetical protein